MLIDFRTVLIPGYMRTRITLGHAQECNLVAQHILEIEVRGLQNLGPLVVMDYTFLLHIPHLNYLSNSHCYCYSTDPILDLDISPLWAVQFVHAIWFDHVRVHDVPH